MIKLEILDCYDYPNIDLNSFLNQDNLIKRYWELPT